MLTNEKKQDNARSHSYIVEVSDNGHVVIGVRIVQCYHAIMDNSEHVVIGVRIVQCYHAIMDNADFSTWSQFQLVVRLCELIVTFPCSYFMHTLTLRKHVI